MNILNLIGRKKLPKENELELNALLKKSKILVIGGAGTIEKLWKFSLNFTCC